MNALPKVTRELGLEPGSLTVFFFFTFFKYHSETPLLKTMGVGEKTRHGRSHLQSQYLGSRSRRIASMKPAELHSEILFQNLTNSRQ